MSELEHQEIPLPEPLPDRVPVARAVDAGGDIQFFDIPLGYAPTPLPQVMPMPMSRLRAFIELLVLFPAAVAGAWGAYIALGGSRFHDHRWMNVATSMGMGTSVLLCIAFMLWLNGHRTETIGWTARRLWGNVGIGLAAFVLMYVYAILLLFVIAQLFPSIFNQEPTAQKAIEQTFPPMNFLPMLVMMLFVGIWEEVAFRGFMLTRLQAIFRRWWLTVPVGAMIFGSIHIYQGIAAVGMIAVMGFIMGILFVWRRSLVPSIAFHFANNIVMMQLLRWIAPDW